jgi:hypothetical protein
MAVIMGCFEEVVSFHTTTVKDAIPSWEDAEEVLLQEKASRYLRSENGSWGHYFSNLKNPAASPTAQVASIDSAGLFDEARDSQPFHSTSRSRL